MSRLIKFRVYSNYYKKYLDTSGEGIFCEVHHLALKPDGKLYYADIGIEYPGTLSECPTLEWEEDYDDCVVEQYTGLKDKNGDIEIYEYDIIDGEGNVIGNYHETPELLKNKTNFLIQGFGTKDWLTTYQEAVERGCHDAE